ncbi:putative serine protease XkdF [Ancylomarina subtilis]|uniref:Putative serine protease XkdF n=1 Tax=Ancylomarina subtilis TaxID=1639035 RepID=A0A4Q7VKK0_9BACT|nr:XkdF-like putative serine protease domain-containing protein [Ancylomarina subtilis]RZT96617.1 putative serine protease XkdF [Ancylomarina subtilis]
MKLNKSDKENTGVFAISIVDKPAIQSNFIALSDNEKKQTIKLSNDDRMILTGAALIPNKKIYRNNVGGDEAYIYFSKETIDQTAEYYFANNQSMNFTLEHKDKTYDVTLKESWIKEFENDKSVEYGLEEEIGTWFVSLKVHDSELWKDIKSGEYNGFSVELNMLPQLKTFFSEEIKPRTQEDVIKDLLELFK